jgi:hypothetical protein
MPCSEKVNNKTNGIPVCCNSFQTVFGMLLVADSGIYQQSTAILIGNQF